MRISASWLAISSLACLGCHPLSGWYPPALDPDEALAIEGSQPRSPAGEVEVIFDDRGAPHVYGKSETDLAYGLGFVHARDRLFQLELIRHAAYGRLTELFGEELLPVDQKLRLVSLGADVQYGALSGRDRRIAEAYAAGVNDGARHAGKSSEMAILGREVYPFTGVDALAISRFQAWQLALGMEDELVRARAAAKLGPKDPRLALFLAPVSSDGVPIVRAPEHTGRPVTPLGEVHTFGSTTAAARPPAQDSLRFWRSELGPTARALVSYLGLDAPGASNSWVVHGSRTKSGSPILCNDPHLAHRAPSVFYLVHLEHPDFTVAGATFPGVPAVLIGHTRHLAWGMTTSYADTQDLVRIDQDPRSPDHYFVDGVRHRYGRVSQHYFWKAGGELVSHDEVWRTTLFGPVLPPGYPEAQDLGGPLALMWGGFSTGVESRYSVSGFWDLYRAKDLDEADRAIEKLSVTGQNMALAFTDGTIAYRLAAFVPIRSSVTPGVLPADGRTSKAAWLGFLPLAERPQLRDPARGYLVAANQRVVDDGGPAARYVGGLAAAPSRALRITERIEALLAEGKPSADELLAIQQDVTSPPARELAPILGRACPRTDDRTRAFCDAVGSFDGRYSETSTSALAYHLLYDALRSDVLSKHLEVPGGGRIGRGYLRTVLDGEIRLAGAGQARPWFDGREGLKAAIGAVLPGAMQEIERIAGGSPSDWTWGDVHRLELSGPLSRAPLIGSFWAIDAGPQAGHGDTPRAEQGLPITNGAAFRMVVELSDPPTARMIIDTGNSGHPGHDNWDDQWARWKDGEPAPLPMTRGDVEAAATGRLLLEARRAVRKP